MSANDVVAQPPKEAEAAEEKVPVSKLRFQKAQYAQKARRFTGYSKRLIEQLAKSKEDESESGKAKSAKIAHQLLRNFSLTYNFVTMSKEDDKAVIPADFAAEIEEVLTSKYYPKFAEAIKAPKEEFEKLLPEEVSSEVIDKLIKFVQVKEKDHVIAKFDKAIEDLKTEIDARKPEEPPKRATPPRQKKPKSKAKKTASDSSKDEDSAEDQLRNAI